jgi:hypothetical protein
MFVPIKDSLVKTLLATLVAAAVLGACGGGADDGEGQDAGAESQKEEAASGTLEFAATEYAFGVPETVTAGETKLTLKNSGDEPHMLDLVPLTDDAPEIEKLIKLPEKKVEKFFKGRPIHIKPVKPGETSKPVDANLMPGRYGYVCFFAEKGEKPHAFKGMFGELTVE